MANNQGIYCKYIGNTDNSLLLRLANEEVVEIPLGDFKAFENYNIINGRLDTKCRSFIPIIDEGTIYSYEHLSNTDSERSKKSYTKALILDIVDEKFEHRLYESLLVMDYNNYISMDLMADKAIFTGATPLRKPFGKNVAIKCNTTVIDNPCVYSSILPTVRPRVLVYAKNYVLKHRFMDILTVREIFYIFDVVYEAVTCDYSLSLFDEYHMKIIIDLKRAGLSPKDIEEEVEAIMHTRWMLVRKTEEERFQQYYNIGRILMSSFASCFSLYESVEYKSDKLESILQQLEISIANDIKTLSFSLSSISKYKRLSTEFKKVRGIYK